MFLHSKYINTLKKMNHSRQVKFKSRTTPEKNWDNRYKVKKEYKLKHNLDLVHYYDDIMNKTDPFASIKGSQLVATKYICVGHWVVMQWRICKVTSIPERLTWPSRKIINGVCIASGLNVSIMALDTTNLCVIPVQVAQRYQVLYLIFIVLY